MTTSPKARKQMYGALTQLQRRRLQMLFAISKELELQGIGAGQAWQQRWRTIEKAQDARIEAWADAQLSIDPPIPQTALEEMLHKHHQLRWAEWNLCDEIEKRWGEVSPHYDTRLAHPRKSLSSESKTATGTAE